MFSLAPGRAKARTVRHKPSSWSQRKAGWPRWKCRKRHRL